MRKIKKFSLAEGHTLSPEEMAMLEGGGNYLRHCYSYTVGEPCAHIGDEIVSTGYCVANYYFNPNVNNFVYEYKCSVV